MPRPKTKREVIQKSQENFSKLNDLVDSFSEKEQLIEFPPGTLNREIKDVLAHLHEWNVMMLTWYEIGMKGGKPEMPAKGYTWRTLPDLNKEIYEKHSDSELKEIRQSLRNSFEQLQKLIKKHTEAELFEKKRYKWTGSTSLGAYLISSTSSHYDWAFKLIKQARK